MATSPQGAARRKIQASEGDDVEKLKAEVAGLVLQGWKLDDDAMGIEARFRFPNFTRACDFMNVVNVESKIRNHHPETHNSERYVYLHWTTHRPRGLSANDVEMAHFCHEKALALKGEYQDDVTSWRSGCEGCEA